MIELSQCGKASKLVIPSTPAERTQTFGLFPSITVSLNEKISLLNETTYIFF